MDELFKPDEFRLQFPLWMLVHPSAEAERFIQVAGAGGEQATPLFTDKGLAERFRGRPGLGHYELGLAAGPGELLGVLGVFERRGYTHVAIDPGTERALFFTVGELCSCCIADGGP